MSAPGSFVRAIVVTNGRPEYLAETLTALAHQDRKVDAWHVVLVEGRHRDGRDVGIPPGLGIPVTSVTASNFGEAVDALLAGTPGNGEWLWLLHDDSAPLPDALSRLLAVTRKRRSAGVVGAAQVRWDDTRILVNVGVTVSGSGRRLNDVEEEDLDQGQHGGREDVLAVGLAGALVRRDLWEHVGGTDPAYGVFGDSTDLCRKAWRAGVDVVVAPAARVRHAQASLMSRPDPASPPRTIQRTYAARRASEWYHALAWAPLWLTPLLGIRSFVASVVRSVGRLVGGEPRLAAAELRVPALLAVRLHSLMRSRKEIARLGTIPVERPLLASLRDVIRQARTRELGAYEAWRTENRPSDIQAREIAALAVRRRWTLVALVVVASALSVALYGTWIAPLFRGEMLTGQALGTTDVSAASLWARSWTGWSDAGFGTGALDGTFASLMIPFALIPGGLILSLGLLLTFSPLLAALSAWFAVGAATRSLVARFSIAMAWAAWPTLTGSVADGRVGAVLVHLLLPLLALALARAMAVNRRDRLGDGEEFPRRRLGSPFAAAAAALLLAAISVAAPILLLPLVIAVLGVAILARGNRGRVALVPIPALVLHGHALVSTWQAHGMGAWWTLLVREPGPALSSTPVSSWDLLWGVGQSPPPWPAATATGNLIFTYLPGVVLVALAFLALASGRAPIAVRAGWLLGALGLGSAIIAQRTLAYASPADSVVANGWPGPGLSLLSLGFLIAVASAIGAGASASRKKSILATSGRGVLVLVSCSLLAVHLGATIWPGRSFGGDVHPTAATVLPLVAAFEQSSQPETRVLLLFAREDGSVGYEVLGSNGESSLLGRASQLPGEGGPFDGTANGDIAILEPAVAALVGAGSGGADALRDWGMGIVVVAPGSEILNDGLVQTDSLTLIGASALGDSWRVRATVDSGVDTRVARAWIEEPNGVRDPLNSEPSGLSTSVGAGDEGRLVVVATPVDSRWRATLNGSPLTVADAGGRQAFALGGGSGHLEVEYHDATYRAWWWAGVVVLAWTLLGAVPLGNRTFRKERR